MKQKSVKRSSILVAEFENGFAKGWHMAVKESFRNELDIKYLPRKKDKTTYYEWSQGPYYCFSQGQTFYDSANTLSDWKSSLQHINIACQIIEAKPNIPIKIKNDTTDKYVYTVEEGYVKFLILKVNPERTSLQAFACYQRSQNDFVNFLKTGEL